MGVGGRRGPGVGGNRRTEGALAKGAFVEPTVFDGCRDDMTIVREEIRVQSVRAKMAEPGYGWLRVSQFQDRTVDDFVRKVDELFDVYDGLLAASASSRRS